MRIRDNIFSALTQVSRCEIHSRSPTQPKNQSDESLRCSQSVSQSINYLIFRFGSGSTLSFFGSAFSGDVENFTKFSSGFSLDENRHRQDRQVQQRLNVQVISSPVECDCVSEYNATWSLLVEIVLFFSKYHSFHTKERTSLKLSKNKKITYATNSKSCFWGRSTNSAYHFWTKSSMLDDFNGVWIGVICSSW